jgi:bidirectional [NiFe] hydrogenase diaphorase subunit
MYGILEKIAAGTASATDLALLEELCDLIRNTSLCGLGQSAPNGVITTLRYFRREYEAHIGGQPCSTCKPAKEVAQ